MHMLIDPSISSHPPPLRQTTKNLKLALHVIVNLVSRLKKGIILLHFFSYIESKDEKVLKEKKT